jgi:hypothetical protein
MHIVYKVCVIYLLFVLAFYISCSFAYANKSLENQKSKSAQTVVVAGQTDIVAQKITPMVTNILQWQESKAAVPKHHLNSILNKSFEPTDRDHLANKTRYSLMLNESSNTLE